MRSFAKQAIGLLLILFFASSCNLERQLAKQYVADTRMKAVILPVDFIYKSNLKTAYVDSLGIKDEARREKMLWEQSDFIKDINDSLFIANYVFGLETELKRFGVEVFRARQMEQFMEQDGLTFQVSIAQIEIEESFVQSRDATEIYDLYYYHDHYLNALLVHSWFEIVLFDDTASDHPVLFATDIITDQVDGEFRYDVFTERVQYMYNTDSLNLSKIYDFAFDLGRAYGAYSFDYLLNRSIKKDLPDDYRSNKYWRYDPYRGNFFEAEDDRFIPLDSE